MITFQIKEYIALNGFNPFRHWLESLEVETKARVQARLFRIQQGNLGDYKSVGHGVYELRLQFGSGYRVYYGLDGKNLIILLIAGDKKSQRKDIIKARQNFIDYKWRS